MKKRSYVIPLALLLFAGTAIAEPPAAVKHQITGLFCPSREADLRELLQQFEDIRLVSLDYSRAEVELAYDSEKVFSGASPPQVIERLDQRLSGASHFTFGVKPVCAVPRDQLQRIEIQVAGLDCKACCLAAYEAIYRIEGVEQATADFKTGLVIAWIHPQTTNRAVLEEALKQRGVSL